LFVSQRRMFADARGFNFSDAHCSATAVAFDANGRKGHVQLEYVIEVTALKQVQW
jgi:hypothetical protein